MLEKQIEQKVCKYAESRGLLQYKFSSPGHSSVPDRLFMLPGGKVFFIEFKKEGKEPTAPQQREHDRMRSQGSLVFVVDEVIHGQNVIDFVIEKYT